MPALLLKPGREKSLQRRHPWVFSGAVDALRGDPGLGDTVEIRSANGEFVAWGAYSPHSQITARVWSFNPDESITPQYIRARLERAIAARQPILPGQARRLVHAESDHLPGFVLDDYAGTLVGQFLSAGAERWREQLVSQSLELTGASNFYERSDVDVRELEGLQQRVARLSGEGPAQTIILEESGLRFGVDVRRGHKTGFYLDQRLNRERVRSLAHGRDMLDCFCYTGGFTANALLGGAASVIAIDASADALEIAQKNLQRNDLPSARVRFEQADVFQALRKFRDSRASFDLIVLDPPKFAHTAAQAERAARGYKDINLLALKLLRPGGMLLTFSCSGGISAELFQKIVAGAALDAGVDAQIIEFLHQSPDHPVLISFPEGEYLKGLVLRVA